LNRIKEISITKGFVTEKMEISENRIDRRKDFPLR
jgi:hypothetical protein